MPGEHDDFIGKGWDFPIRVNAKGGLGWSSGPDRIQNAIWIILKTSLGERVMRPQFGARVNEFVFQPNSSVVRTDLVAAIRRALLQWEPRIDLEAVRAQPVENEPSQVLISIKYRLRTTNQSFNIVYPFYLGEGAS
jgi:phage baseplate assembly protein W